jgi:hypothetical protein
MENRPPLISLANDLAVAVQQSKRLIRTSRDAAAQARASVRQAEFLIGVSRRALKTAAEVLARHTDADRRRTTLPT